jgi:site-specific DNA-methyltransferase (adenine-specific)
MGELHAAGERFDLMFTSPPYNLGTNPVTGERRSVRRGEGSKWACNALGDGYEGHDDAMPPWDYEDWQKACLRGMWGLTTERGAVFYNHKPRVQEGRLWTPLSLNPGLPLRQIIVWSRNGGYNFTTTHYCPTHEWLLMFARPAFGLRDQAASGAGDVWRIPNEGDSPHPAPFPLALPSQAMETTPAGPVFDPFCGSGTTLVAAKQHGRQGVGVDSSERYLEMAAKRLSQEVLPFAEPTLPLGAEERTERWRRQRERGKREAAR